MARQVHIVTGSEDGKLAVHGSKKAACAHAERYVSRSNSDRPHTIHRTDSGYGLVHFEPCSIFNGEVIVSAPYAYVETWQVS